MTISQIMEILDRMSPDALDTLQIEDFCKKIFEQGNHNPLSLCQMTKWHTNLSIGSTEALY